MRIRGFIPAATFVTSLAVAACHNSPQNSSFGITPHHVGISVANLDESAAWYQRMLDFERVRFIPDADGNGLQVVQMRRADFYIELFHAPEAEPMPEYRSDPSADLRVHGVKHLGFEVTDARGAAAELEAKGAEIAFGPNENERSIFVFIRDNSGNTFELIQPKN